ncbi:MAG: hypothetical protein QY323_04875 [Patescibacteria group bacterium]|nr:MAG: hypothetical protein QY323_04875 [Patescibacteria group bacterium]
MWPILSLVLILGACAPNTFRARGTVLHPLHDPKADNPEEGRAPLLLVIKRKETRVQVKHTIVGPQNKPKALTFLGEFCEILTDKTTGTRVVFQCLLFSNYKDELVEMKQSFTLKLPDGRKLKGELHAKNALQDHTSTITGAHMQTHMVVRDRDNGQVRRYRHVEEVANEFPLFSRMFKIVFYAEGTGALGTILDTDTSFLELSIDGYQRRWIYHFDFTDDPNAAMRWWIDHME